ncbi:MAG: YIP1 family protein [Methanomicrobium sp.]|nr:YIP1 family protein [Methanomicrobium sp.]
MQIYMDFLAALTKSFSYIPSDIVGIIRRPVKTLREIRSRKISDVLVLIFSMGIFYSVLLSIVIFCNLDIFYSYEFLNFAKPHLWIPIIYGLVIADVFLNTLFIHVFVIIVEGKNGLFETLKSVSYSSVPTLILGWIPIIGIITTVWALVLQTIAIRELHEISTGRAVIAMILPYIIFICLFVSLFFIPAPFPIF